MFFETEPHRWGFHNVAGHKPTEPMLTADGTSRARPKFSGFDASRPGLFAPRPFQREPLQRERRSSDGTSCTSEEDRHSQASSTGSCAEPEARPAPGPAAPRERIIPIRLERDDEEPEEQSSNQQQPEPEEPPPPQRPARRHERRDTVDGGHAGSPHDSPCRRDTRAHSCPVTSPPAAGTKLTPLNVDEAFASQKREAKQTPGRPSYTNMSPKPFSPGARPLQAASFGMFGSPTRSFEPSAPRPPPVPPKPSGLETRSAKELQQSRPQSQPQPQPEQQPQQQQQTEQQQQTQQPRSAKEEVLDKIATIHTGLDPLTRRLEAFAGTRGDKEYLYLDEMLTRRLIQLDGLETGGDAEVRTARKEAVRRIELSLGRLERQSTPPEAAEHSRAVLVKACGGVQAAEGRAASAPPAGLVRAEPALVGGRDAPHRPSLSVQQAGGR